MSLERLLTSSYSYQRELARYLLQEKIIPRNVHIDDLYLTLNFSNSFIIWMYEEEYFCHFEYCFKKQIRLFDISAGIDKVLLNSIDIIEYIKNAELRRNLS